MKRSLFLVFGVTSAYAALRYCVFGNVSPQHLPLFVANKALCWTGLVLVGLAPFAKSKQERTKTGNAGFVLLAMHAIASTIILEPAYLPSLFLNDGTLSVTAEVGMVLGIIALVLVTSLFFGTRTQHPPDATSKTNPFRFYGRMIMILGIGHCAFLGSKGWLDHESWPAHMPPITLLAACCACFLLVLRYARTRSRS